MNPIVAMALGRREVFAQISSVAPGIHLCRQSRGLTGKKENGDLSRSAAFANPAAASCLYALLGALICLDWTV